MGEEFVDGMHRTADGSSPRSRPDASRRVPQSGAVGAELPDRFPAAVRCRRLPDGVISASRASTPAPQRNCVRSPIDRSYVVRATAAPGLT